MTRKRRGDCHRSIRMKTETATSSQAISHQISLSIETNKNSHRCSLIQNLITIKNFKLDSANFKNASTAKKSLNSWDKTSLERTIFIQITKLSPMTAMSSSKPKNNVATSTVTTTSHYQALALRLCLPLWEETSQEANSICFAWETTSSNWSPP